MIRSRPFWDEISNDFDTGHLAGPLTARGHLYSCWRLIMENAYSDEQDLARLDA